MYKIGIRLDVGHAIGYGHFVRCLALAKEINKTKKTQVTFIVRNPLDIQIDFPIIRLNKQYSLEISDEYKYESLDDEIGEMKELLKKEKFDCLIVDNYGVSQKYFEKLKQNVEILVYIDDFHQDDYAVDILVNGNCYAKELKYDNSKLALLGSEYTLLREEFGADTNRKLNSEVKVISITSGGSDPMNFTVTMIKILKQIEIIKDMKKNIIIGSGFQNINEIKEEISTDKSFSLRYHANMKEIMLESDLFITASGSTLYELAVTGTPSISWILSYDQELVAQYLDKLGTTMNMGFLNNDTDKFVSELKELVMNYDKRSTISKSGRRLVDGKGCSRVTEEIIRYLEVE